MLEDTSSQGDKLAFAFFEIIGFALGWIGVEHCYALDFVRGLPLVAGCLASCAVGIYWPWIRVKLRLTWTKQIDAIANNYRYRYSFTIVLIGLFVFYVVTSMRDLHNDFEKYVLPRHLAQSQFDKLTASLTKIGANTIYFKSSNNQEANEYATQLEEAFRRSGWQVEMGSPDDKPLINNPGMELYETGVGVRKDRDARLFQMLQMALGDADIPWGGAGGDGPGVEYRIFILVGTRPLRVGEQPPFRNKLAHWLESL